MNEGVKNNVIEPPEFSSNPISIKNMNTVNGVIKKRVLLIEGINIL